jgi:hypothetical protein
MTMVCFGIVDRMFSLCNSYIGRPNQWLLLILLFLLLAFLGHFVADATVATADGSLISSLHGSALLHFSAVILGAFTCRFIQSSKLCRSSSWQKPPSTPPPINHS